MPWGVRDPREQGGEADLDSTLEVLVSAHLWSDYPAAVGLLADLCYKFQAHPEVLATEALTILLRDRSLGDALARFLSTQLALTPPLPTGLSFKTQDSDADGGRPDIVALRADGHPCVVVEVKFWAGLTEKQPVTYLERPDGHQKSRKA